MGVMSRRVLPVFGKLFVCCPGLRARSRQPIKRYKKLLGDIFPHSQEELPNDRKIGKLADYAAKNPFRIPKIANFLEQRGYKELRAGHFGSVRVIMQTFCKLLSCCRDQVPLFAVNVLNMIHTLLDQTRFDEMRVLGCRALFNFIYNQSDGTYLRNLEGLLPNLFTLAREIGEEERRSRLRAAGLQAISAMIWFVGEYSHLSFEFDQIVVVTLDNYGLPSIYLNGDNKWDDTDRSWVKDVVKGDGRAVVVSMKDTMGKLSSQRSSYLKDALNLIRVENETPRLWAQISVQNLASVARVATTVRRILDPMLHYFDVGNHWSPEQGLALTVLQDMFLVMEKSGNEHLLLAALVRHLDHKNVSHQAQMKTDIVEVVAILMQESKSKASVTEVGVLNDVFRNFRRCLQSSLEDLNPLERNWNTSLQSALEECLMQFTKRVGNINVIFEMMAVNMENLSATVSISRATIIALNVLANIVVTFFDQSHGQGFPELLFHPLSQLLVHPDVEIRLGAHLMLAVLLVPTSLFSRTNNISFVPESSFDETKKVLSRSSSAFASVTALYEKLKRDRSGFLEDRDGGDTFMGNSMNINTEKEEMGMLKEKKDRQDIGPIVSSKIWGSQLSLSRALMCSLSTSSSTREIEMTAVRLTGEQATVLFSALWVQAQVPDNLPVSFEAMAHTYSLILLFSRAKVSNHRLFIQSFQLPFSMRTLALSPNGTLPPSHQRSLFILATAMIMFAARIFNIQDIIPAAKAPLLGCKVDPFLELINDSMLKMSIQIDIKDYGTPADNAAAMEFISGINLSENSSNEALAFLIYNSLIDAPEEEKTSMQEEALQPFSADDIFMLQSQLQLETGYTHYQNDILSAEALESNFLLEDDLISDTSCTELPWFISKVPIPTPPTHVMGVNQLLESALETAGQVATVPLSTTPLSYSAMASQCEAFSSKTKKKMPVWMQLGTDTNTLFLTIPADEKLNQVLTKETDDFSSSKPKSGVPLSIVEVQKLWQTLQLPPASPYDNFMRAAGC